MVIVGKIIGAMLIGLLLIIVIGAAAWGIAAHYFISNIDSDQDIDQWES